jgi:hypothetical protein
LGGDRCGIVEEFVWYEEAGARAVTCEEEGGRTKTQEKRSLLSDAVFVFIPAPPNLDFISWFFDHGVRIPAAM